MNNSDIPLYQSGPSKKSMGNEYSIYLDRIELKCRFPFFKKTLIIAKDDLVSIDVFSPPVIRTTFCALKLDSADFNKHVGLERKKGLFKKLRFTPANPEEFVQKAKEIFKLHC